MSSIINRITTWTSQILTSASLNGEFNNVVNVLNNLDNATTVWDNVKTAALISTTSTALKATSTNDNAAVGNIGEVLSNSAVRSGPVSLTSGAPINIAALTLTAGDWDVRCMAGVRVGAGATSITLLQFGLSTTTGTQPGADTTCVPDSTGQVGSIVQAAGGSPILPGATNDMTMPTLVSRVSLGASTNYYAVVLATFTVSTLSAYGSMVARRIR